MSSLAASPLIFLLSFVFKTMDTTEAHSVSERVLQVLVTVARHGRPIAAREIAAQTSLPLSTVYRHLVPLKKWGLVQEHAHEALYEPGPVGVQLAWGFDHNSHLVTQAREEIDALVQRTGETVGLLVAANGQVVCLDMHESEQSLRCSFAKGRAHPLVHGASAKALLSFLPQATRESLIGRQLAGQPVAQERLVAQVEEIRKQRYAVSESEVDFGVWGVSAPVFAAKERLEGTITLMAPAVRVAQRHEELIRLTVAAAERISNRLQYF